MLTPIHARMARAALRWTLEDLNERTGISKNTLLRFELGGGIHLNTAIAIEEAFTREGIVFTYESDQTGPSVGLSKDLAERMSSTITRAQAERTARRNQPNK